MMTAKSTSASIFLQKIANWDGTSQDINQALTTAFEADDYRDCIKNLRARDIEPLSYINSLDKIIVGLPVDSELRKRCIQALRKTCGLYGKLPTSFEVAYTLNKPGQRPFAYGGFSDVWKLTDDKNPTLVFAVKSLRVYEHDPVERIHKKYCKAVIALKHTKHPNVLSIEGVAPKLFEFCTVSQWMTNGNMSEYVAKHPEVNRFDLLLGVTRGLNYLHNNEIVHGDLKSPNILIDARGSPRLSGFGLCSLTKNIDTVNGSTPHHSHTPRYCAPELLDGEDVVEKRKPTNKSDVYALSMIIVELTTGKKPFPDYTDPHVLVLKGKRPSIPTRFEAPGMTAMVWKIAKKCWNPKANERPEVNTVLQYLENLADPVDNKNLRKPLLRRLREAFGG